MRHNAQECHQYAIKMPSRPNNQNSRNMLSFLLISNVPSDANVTSSHTNSKITCEENDQVRLRALISTHISANSMKEKLKTYCCIYSPDSIRVVSSFSNLNRLKLAKANVKYAFMNSGSAERNMYVITLRESSDIR